ncbi:hypothetical protein BLNAU_1622 [Blattamonas nauphoetae]|uniref:Uncharacterized protein n=1 Tax=Blattamonas nauphoetae TaxID=2049346 RepID=A0ABQ9YIJ2_9EUKA|nr:hypothetical protein BLNAU_1622 [Blattamonas nauphoetae]
MDDVASLLVNGYLKIIPNDLSFADAFQWMMSREYFLIHFMEDNELVDHRVRLTDAARNNQSPQFTIFTKMLTPELEKLKKQFDPDLFEEARRITSWRELLQRVASGEEVLNDQSFLKSSVFRPTLLSLQEKFQHLASSVEGSESLKLLTILHTLLVSPLPPTSTSLGPQQAVFVNEALIHSIAADADPREKFQSSIFDEVDNEILTRSLIRCHSVCNLVGVGKCVFDIPQVVDRTDSALGRSHNLVSLAASSQLHIFDNQPFVIPHFSHLWDRLRSAFRDGRPEEQAAHLQMSTTWMIRQRVDLSLPPFPASQFDLDGPIHRFNKERDKLCTGSHTLVPRT